MGATMWRNAIQWDSGKKKQCGLSKHAIEIQYYKSFVIAVMHGINFCGRGDTSGFRLGFNQVKSDSWALTFKKMLTMDIYTI